MSNSKLGRRLVLFMSSVLLLAPVVSFAQPPAQSLKDAAKSVVQVIARECGNPQTRRTGTGFMWRTSGEVVTAMHVIAGCKNIRVYFEGSGEVAARPARVLLARDLALLSIPQQAGRAPLQASSSEVATNDTLHAIGYYLDVPTLDSRPLKATIGSRILQDMLTQNIRSALIAAGSPNINTHILRLDGNLMPGLSGAPLIDSAGRVAGIGSGGLENGTVGVSWAIQSKYLNDLSTAQEINDTSGYQRTHGLFSYAGSDGEGRKYRCGAMEFVKTKTRTYAELAATTDDGIGLQQLANSSGLNMSVIQGMAFDVYTELRSGGSVALPGGAELEQKDGQCIAQITDQLYIVITGTYTNGDIQIAQAAAVFESKFPGHGFQWRLDPGYTYATNLMRQDGLRAYRKNIVGSPPGNPIDLRGDAFQTLMDKGLAFIGVRAVDTSGVPPRYYQCKMQWHTGCPTLQADHARFISAILGVHMSTFPAL